MRIIRIMIIPFVGLLFTVAACDHPIQSITQLTSSYVSTQTTTPTKTTPTQNSLTMPKTSPIPTQQTTIAITTKVTPFTANIIKVNDKFSDDRYGVLFTNNTTNYFRFSCTIIQHDANGSYLSDYSVTSSFVPPNSHVVTILPEDIINGLTMTNLQIFNTPVNPSLQFGNMSISNIRTVPEVTTDNRGDKSFAFLTGKLINNSGIKPASISIQILKRNTDGSLSLAGNSFVTSGGGGNLGSSPSIISNAIPIPPSGESVIFYLPLWQDITIKDGQNAVIDGEIVIVAPSQ